MLCLPYCSVLFSYDGKARTPVGMVTINPVHAFHLCNNSGRVVLLCVCFFLPTPVSGYHYAGASYAQALKPYPTTLLFYVCVRSFGNGMNNKITHNNFQSAAALCVALVGLAFKAGATIASSYRNRKVATANGYVCGLSCVQP